jgi:ferritin-like metal-binding protein YciE
MPRRLETLEELYFEQLRDLYDAEGQLVDALPRMAQAASSERLSQAFAADCSLTQVHRRELEHLFAGAGLVPSGHRCEGMSGLLQEGLELMGSQSHPGVVDAGLVIAAQKAQHYEMAGYGSASAFAAALGRSQEVQVLERLVYEEKLADAALTELAQGILNPSAPAR